MKRTRTSLFTLLMTAALSLTACGEQQDVSPTPPPTQQPPARGYAPLPDTARGLPIDPAVGYTVKDLGGGLYFVGNGSDQAAFLVSTEGVIVIDAPPQLAQGLAAAIRATTSQQVTHLVYSHHHADHIGGASRISTSAQVVAHAATKRELERAKDPNRPVPTVTFEDRYTLTVGEQRLELAYLGANHTEGNIFIHAPRQRTLVLIDVVWPGWVPFTGFGEPKDVRGYRQALEQALAYDFDTFIGGHVGRYGTRADIEKTKAYVDDVFAEAGQTLAQVQIYDVAREVGFENPYMLVDVWFERMKQQCGQNISNRWTGALGGADVWPGSHCFVALQSLRID